jgi:hypothetical protein
MAIGYATANDFKNALTFKLHLVRVRVRVRVRVS